MFYSHEILSRKGGKLGIVWIAATFNSKNVPISKREYKSVSVVNVCDEVAHPPAPFSLRLSSNLLVGISRIYERQTNYFWSDTRQLLYSVNRAHVTASSAIELNQPQARFEAITLPTAALNSSIDYTFEEISSQMLMEGNAGRAGDGEFISVPLYRQRRASDANHLADPSNSPIGGGLAHVAHHANIRLVEKDLDTTRTSIEIPGDDFGGNFDGGFGGEDAFFGVLEHQPSLAGSFRTRSSLNDTRDSRGGVSSHDDTGMIGGDADIAFIGDNGYDMMQIDAPGPAVDAKEADPAGLQGRRKRKRTLLVDADIQLNKDAYRTQLIDTSAITHPPGCTGLEARNNVKSAATLLAISAFAHQTFGRTDASRPSWIGSFEKELGSLCNSKTKRFGGEGVRGLNSSNETAGTDGTRLGQPAPVDDSFGGGDYYDDPNISNEISLNITRDSIPEDVELLRAAEKGDRLSLPRGRLSLPWSVSPAVSDASKRRDSLLRRGPSPLSDRGDGQGDRDPSDGEPRPRRSGRRSSVAPGLGLAARGLSPLTEAATMENLGEEMAVEYEGYTTGSYDAFSAAGAMIEEETRDFLTYFTSKLDGNEATLGSILPDNAVRLVAAKAFLHVLSLASHSILSVAQSRAYGPIALSRGLAY